MLFNCASEVSKFYVMNIITFIICKLFFKKDLIWQKVKQNKLIGSCQIHDLQIIKITLDHQLIHHFLDIAGCGQVYIIGVKIPQNLSMNNKSEFQHAYNFKTAHKKKTIYIFHKPLLFQHKIKSKNVIIKLNKYKHLKFKNHSFNFFPPALLMYN